MTTHLPRIPTTPPAEQRADWIGAAQRPDGTWEPIAGPGLRREVGRQVRAHRSNQGHLAPETRVRLP